MVVLTCGNARREAGGTHMQNIGLAWNVVGRIREHPGSFRMRNWGVLLKGDGDGDGDVAGYQACLGGHTLLESGYELLDDNVFCSPQGSLITHPGQEAFELLGLSRKEYRRGAHWWKCNVFCETMTEDEALSNFLQLIYEDQQARPVLAALLG
jgi:hypothetical protein